MHMLLNAVENGGYDWIPHVLGRYASSVRQVLHHISNKKIAEKRGYL